MATDSPVVENDGVATGRPEDDVMECGVTMIGKGMDTSKVFAGKPRADEEDAWPEPESERTDVQKAQTEQQSSEAPREAFVGEILDPPLSFQSLITAFEESNALRQNVDAMVTNVDGFGHTFVPVHPLESDEFIEAVADEFPALSEADLKTKVEEYRKEALLERRRLKRFFDYCADEGFIELRRDSREELEVEGNWAWEVLRNKAGDVRRFARMPFFSVRLAKRCDPVTVKIKRKVADFKYEEVEERLRFRRFVQKVGTSTIWFKEFGDPRPMSKKTGQYYKTDKQVEAMAKEDPSEGLATEVLLYQIKALRGAYGLPRWIGNLTSVLGSRKSEEVNLFYFDNKAIPPMIIFVENGRLNDGSADRLADFMEEVKGDTGKFHNIAIIEGESSEAARKRGVQWTGQPRFKIERLSSEMLKDALFTEYDEKNRDKIGESFRIPRLLRGDVRDFNRATALTAKAFAEEQVFEPERDRFDSFINRYLGPSLNMRFWKFKSLAPIVRDPKSLTEMVSALTKVGVLTPREGRVIAEDIFNRDFTDIKEDWVERPLMLTISAGARGKTTGENNSIDGTDILDGMQPKQMRDVLGLGEPGDPIDHDAVIARLLEVRHDLARRVTAPKR